MRKRMRPALGRAGKTGNAPAAQVRIRSGRRRAAIALTAVPVALAVVLAMAGPASAGRSERAADRAAITARSAVHKKRSPVKRARIVDAAKLPPPQKGKVEKEPKETMPRQLKPRTTGIIQLVQGKGSAVGPVSPARPAFTLGVSVGGLQRNGTEPPDTQVAVGGSKGQWIVEFVNRGALVLNRGGTVLGTFDLGALFYGVPGIGGDPKIVYDPASGDFFASYLRFSDNGSGPSTVSLGVASNPLGTWVIYTVSAEGILQDQPKLGFSSNKIVMSWNQNGNGGPEQYKVIQKAGIVAHAASVPGVIWGPDSSRLNVIPAVQLTPGNTAYAIYHPYNGTKVGVMSFTGVPGISPVSVTETDRSVARTTSPPAASQPGAGSPKLDTGDDRLESAVWSNGNLWAGGNDSCRYRTDTAARSCLRIIHISTATMTVRQDVDITMVGGDVMYPAVMIDSQGDFWVAFSSSSATQYSSSEVAEAPGGTIGATIGGIIYRTGSGPISYSSCTKPPVRQRFGDYSGAADDPAESGIWAATEWGAPSAKVQCSWATQVAQFRP